MRFISKNLILALFISSITQAQNNIALKGGLNMATMPFKTSGIKVENKNKFLFHIGAMSEISLNNEFSLQPGVFLSTKGTEYRKSMGTGYINNYEIVDYSPIYIDIPINAIYKTNLISNKLFFTIGPYFSYGIGGKNIFGHSIKFGKGEEYYDLKPFDFGINFGTGLKIQNIQISLQYSLGLRNIAPVTTNNTKTSNRVKSISIAYSFGNESKKEKKTVDEFKRKKTSYRKLHKLVVKVKSKKQFTATNYSCKTTTYNSGTYKGLELYHVQIRGIRYGETFIPAKKIDCNKFKKYMAEQGFYYENLNLFTKDEVQSFDFIEKYIADSYLIEKNRKEQEEKIRKENEEKNKIIQAQKERDDNYRNALNSAKEQAERNGKQFKEYSTGYYVGDLKDGIREGYGTFTFKRVEDWREYETNLIYYKSYQGNWKNDVYDGQGKLVWEKRLEYIIGRYRDEWYYEGSFVNGKKNGEGWLNKDNVLYENDILVKNYSKDGRTVAYEEKSQKIKDEAKTAYLRVKSEDVFSKSDDYTEYKFTFKDGYSGYLRFSFKKSEWCGSEALDFSWDRCFTTKNEALEWLYIYKH